MMKGDERPSDIVLTAVPFWIQVHGLQIRAMTRGAAGDLTSLLGKILDVKSDYDGVALGECVRVRTMVDIRKPLHRWATINIEESMCRVIFRYEKLSDFCYYCGRLNHHENDCDFVMPDGKKHFGPWMRANGQHSVSLETIIAELEKLNARKPSLQLSHSPNTLTLSTRTNSPASIPDWSVNKVKGQTSAPTLHSAPKDEGSAKKKSSTLTPASCAPDWKRLLPKHNPHPSPSEIICRRHERKDARSPTPR